LTALATAATDEGTPNAKRTTSHRLDIQGLRAIAVLMVVAFHAGLPVPGGFVGVDVFFVISGFVITAMLMREWSASGRIRLGRFYVRRFKRLTPALAVTVAAVMLASVLLLSPFGSQQIAAQTGLGAMLLAANVIIARTTGDYFDAPAESNPLLNTWSLSVEEQFYIVFPAILLIGWQLGKRLRHPKRVAVLVVSLVGAVSFALAVAGSAGIQLPLLPDSLVGFYGPGTRAWEFAVGALLALVGTRLSLTSRRLALASAIVGATMVGASLWLITGTTPFPGVWTLLPVIGTLLLIAAGTADQAASRVLSSGPMVAVGDRSYSIYLWHWPFIVFANLLWPGQSLVTLAAAALSFIPAYASYRWVEQPFRTLPITRGLPLARLVAATVLPPLALAGGVGIAARNGYWTPPVQEYQAAMQPAYASRLAGCHTTTPMNEREPGECTWNANAAGDPIYLVGDSNADHFSDGIIFAAISLDRPLYTSTASGCPFVDVPVVDATKGMSWNAECHAYVQGSLSHLLAADPGTVIVSNSDGYWLPDGASEAGRATRGEPKLRTLSSGLTSTVQALREAGHSVVLVQPIPKWVGEDELVDCSLFSLMTDTNGCNQKMPLNRALERQGLVRGVTSEVAAATGAVVFDTWSLLCTQDGCETVVGGLTRYRDEELSNPVDWLIRRRSVGCSIGRVVRPVCRS
jgi:peptidoglycan/LPS O-acetylase OafA/YrhL